MNHWPWFPKINEFTLNWVIFLWSCLVLQHQWYLRKGSSIKYVSKIFRKTDISNPLIRTPTCAYQGVRDVSLSENFAYVLNGWPLMFIIQQTFVVFQDMSWKSLENTLKTSWRKLARCLGDVFKTSWKTKIITLKMSS